ncbi:MAG: BNR/Asp-box repeat protein [Firmicutes bacterium ADurb.Bin300]|nr:MAG: BNR/Asp-box repeat protein [Firmicutes bacterium ADurb.Bin300]
MTKITAKKKEMIFEEDKYMNSCHASTVLPLEDGTVVAAWFGGTAEGSNDVTIWYSRRKDGLWRSPKKVFVTETMPHWNPVLFQKKDGTILLYFKYGKKVRSWKTYLSYSYDKGKSFSVPKELVPGDDGNGRGPVKNKNVRLKDGTVLAPASSEKHKASWKCFVDISEDDGETFTKSNYVLRPKNTGLPVRMIQPTLWESDEGVHMLVRTNSGYIYRSDSRDKGKTWKKAYKTEYMNPNSGIDLDKLSDGSLVLISNPTSENWGARAPLTLMRSFDNGKTFTEFIKLEAAAGCEHEFSYPAIVAVGMKLYITYTYERKTIAYWEIEIE